MHNMEEELVVMNIQMRSQHSVTGIDKTLEFLQRKKTQDGATIKSHPFKNHNSSEKTG